MLLRDFVNKKIASADKEASAEGVPLVLNNCKKYKKMRDLKVYGNCFQDGTPTPENPIEVQSVGEKSRNLFDPTQAIDDSYVMKVSHNSDGSFNLKGTLGSMNYAYYAQKQERFIASGTVVSLSSTFETTDSRVFIGIMFNDADGNGIIQNNELANGTKATVTLPKDAYSFNFMWRVPGGASGEYIEINNIKIQVEIGSTATDFIPYGKYKISIVQRGKNLCTPCIPVALTNSTYENGVVTQNTADTSANPYFKINAAYTDGSVSVLATTNTALGKRSIKFTLPEKDVNWLDFGLNGSKVDTMIRLQKIPQGTYVISFNVLNNTQGSYSWCDMQIEEFEEGVTPSDYEPYVEPITTNIFLDEPLRKLGTYADCINGKDDKVVRNVYEEFVLSTDSGWFKETWYKAYNAYSRSLKCSPTFYMYATPELCSHFSKNQTHTSASIVDYSFQLAERNMYFFTKKQSEEPDETVEDFKALLAEKEAEGNPVRLYYVLKTPIEEPLNLDLPKLNAKTTIIEVDTSLPPSNISGKYIIR